MIVKKIGDYEVYSDGRIKRNGKELRGSITPKGYIRVTIHGKKKMLHRIIATVFLGDHEEKKQVNHKNGIKVDNRIENLEWVTPSENLIHSYRKLGRKAAFEGKRMPKWIRKKISESNKGKKHSEDWIKHNSESHKGKQKLSENPNSISVICIETGKKYGCIKEIAQEFGFNITSLYNAIRKNKKYKNKTFRNENKNDR